MTQKKAPTNKPRKTRTIAERKAELEAKLAKLAEQEAREALKDTPEGKALASLARVIKKFEDLDLDEADELRAVYEAMMNDVVAENENDDAETE